MLSSADAIGKIQQIYREGNRQVPYPTFIGIFNDLLEDTREVVPKEPGEELAEKFRAACMAVNVGVFDQEGRGEDRIREFKEKVLPVWEEKLSEEEFRKYERILEGEMRTQMGGEGQEAEEQAQPKARGGGSSDLLKRLGISPAEAAAEEAAPAEEEEVEEEEPSWEAEEFELEGAAEEVAEPEPAVEPEAVPPEVEAEAEAPTEIVAEEGPAVCDTIDDLVAAIQEERLPIDWQPRSGQREPAARYELEGREVEVSFVAGNTRNYVIFSVAQGRPDGLNAQEQMDNLAAEMGYRPTSDYYYRRSEGDFLLRIRMWPDRVDVACGYPKGADKETVIQQAQKLHRDTGELLERMSS